MKVFWHFGGRESWCNTIVECLTLGCDHQLGIGPADKAVVVVKADQTPSVDKLNSELAQIDRGVLIVTANEEGLFDTARITHPRMKIWLQTPWTHQPCNRGIPWGWTPYDRRGTPTDRIFDWSFAGQNTHIRREKCLNALRGLPHGAIYESKAFSGGLARNVYFDLLRATRMVPCPSGPLTVDSFRVCEALEMGCIPIVDTATPNAPDGDYWYRVFGERIPFPLIYDWDTVPEVLDNWIPLWQQHSESVQKWWKLRKAEWIRQLAEDVNAWS